MDFLGRQAVMTVYENNQTKEEILLYSLQTRAQMHALFQKLGFKKKGQEIPIVEDKRVQEVETELPRIEQFQPVYSNLIGTYGVIGFVSLAFLLLIRWNGKKRRRALKIRLPVSV